MNLPTNEIHKITSRILLLEPFYGHFMLGMPKTFSTETPTACVGLISKNIIKLSVNATFWEKLNEDHRYGLIKHEVLHVVLKHLFTQKQFSNKQVYNLAADLVVNQYIQNSQLPDGAITLRTFSYFPQAYGITLEPLKSVNYYYKQLMKAVQANNSGSESFELEEGQYHIKDLLHDNCPHAEKHRHWRDFEKLEDAEVKIMEYQLYNQVKGIMEKFKTNPKAIGKLPAHLIEYINDFLNQYKPQLNWKRVLKRFASSSSSTFIKNTVRRPSKRYGTTPGIKVQRKHRILVALDTSGSVPMTDIKTFFGELHHIWRQGAEVVITECDADIQKTYHYKGEIPDKIHGRGGTDFSPPISLANTEIRPDGIVYFTDGYAAPPNIKSRCPILWLITSNGINETEDIWGKLKGQKVKMHQPLN